MTLTSMIPTATRKIAEPITLTWGGTPRAAWPQTKTGNVISLPELKYVMTKSSTEMAKAEQPAGEDRGPEQRQRHEPERRQTGGAEVRRGFLEVAVEVDEARAHGDDDEGDAEHHVRDEDRPEAEIEQRPD